jgi:hypothetical protein
MERPPSGTFSKWLAGIMADNASHDFGQVPERGIDPWRPALIAHCLDPVARAAEKIS